MKKTLSAILTLLIVLGSITCMFIMPVSAVEQSTVKSAGESLPENMLSDVEGKDLAFKNGKKLLAGKYYQLDVTLTLSSASGKLLPKFKSEYGYGVLPNTIVGIRYNKATPGLVETVYNYTGKVEISEDNAATNSAGSYKYTYIFSPAEDAYGVSLTNAVTEANLFALEGTDWDNFFWQGYQVVRYMVCEEGNVFQRFYGYRKIGDTAIGQASYSVSSKIGGDYYNLLYKGGNTYKIKYGFRLPIGTTTNLQYAPSVSVYETQLFDYSTAYKEIRTEMDFLNSDVCKEQFDDEIYFPHYTIFGMDSAKFVSTDYYKIAYDVVKGTHGNTKLYDAKTNQVLFSNLHNAYSTGAWMTTNYIARRIPTTNKKMAELYYKTQDGTIIPSGSAYYSDSSTVGRGYYTDSASTLKSQIGNWLNAEYSLEATGAQSLKEGYETLTKTNNAYASKYFLNRVKNALTGEYEWKYNLLKASNGSCNGAFIAPAEQDTNVALAFTYLYTGAVYDFDNINPVVDIDFPKVVGRDSNGNVTDIHANDNSTEIVFDKVDYSTDKLNLTFNYDASREAYGDFVGWFKGDELITTSKTASLPYSTYNSKDYVAVVEYENYLGNVGGFESYEEGTKLVSPLETITFGEGDSAVTRTQYSEPPTGEYWAQYEWGAQYRLPEGYSYDSNVAEFITESGALTATTDSKGLYAKSTVSINGVAATPHTGKKMAYANQGTYVAVKAIEGLTPGKSYTVSFYTAYCRTDSQGLAAAAVCDTPFDFYCYYNSINGASTVSEPQKILGYKFTNGKLKAPADGTAVWEKVTLYFTADDEIDYLFFRTPNSQTVVDDFVCKEFNEINNTKTEWNFEDGNVFSEGLNNTSCYDYDTNSVVQVVNNDYKLSKLGSKYLKLTTVNKNDNSVNVNFNYNGKDRYILSFDMKVNKYADYVAESENLIEIFASKMGNMGYYQNDYSSSNTLDAKTTLTRYWQSGKTYNKAAVDNDITGLYSFATQAGASKGEYINFSLDDGAAIWNGWQHFEMEINPVSGGYSGPASFGVMATGTGWELCFDNFKVEKIASEDINIIKEAMVGTYAFNIRSKNANGGQGLRFKSTIDLDVLDNFGTGFKVVEYGTLVSDSVKLGHGNLTRQIAMDKARSGVVFAGVAYNRVDGTNVQYALDDETNVLTYTGVLTNFDISQYNITWAVRSYVVIENADGVRTTVYDDVQFLSLAEAAHYIVDNSDNADDVDAAKEVLDVLN